jgi:hypothetical protein
MNPILNNSYNPIREYIAQQDTVKRQNYLLWYSLAIFISIIVTYLVMKNQNSLRRKEEGT